MFFSGFCPFFSSQTQQNVTLYVKKISIIYFAFAMKNVTWALLSVLFLLSCHSAVAQLSVEVGEVSFKMIMVEGGTFGMGCNLDSVDDCEYDETPIHQVTLSSFYMAETEVTQALWREVMLNNPSMFVGDSLPVENVTFDEVALFIIELNRITGLQFRLPTEAEWEFAARGGIHDRGTIFSGSDTLDDVAWFKNNSNVETHTVKSKRPNALGIYDMSGNVREMCSDWKGSYGSAALVDPTGPEYGSKHVYRGGSWYTEENNCRVTYRIVQISSPRSSGLGFRLAMSLPHSDNEENNAE